MHNVHTRHLTAGLDSCGRSDDWPQDYPACASCWCLVTGDWLVTGGIAAGVCSGIMHARCGRFICELGNEEGRRGCLRCVTFLPKLSHYLWIMKCGTCAGSVHKTKIEYNFVYWQYVRSIFNDNSSIILFAISWREHQLHSSHTDIDRLEQRHE